MNKPRSPTETNFYATFKPSLSVSESQVQLNINGVYGATAHGWGFTPDTELKGIIYVKPDIADVPNYYTIVTFGSTLIFLFRANDRTGPIIGGASFPNPFKTDIDWDGNLKWEHLVPTLSKANGTDLVAPNATPE